ncbi:MAG TPA: DUF4266 domain-containing protein [Polyangiales bacterium]
MSRARHPLPVVSLLRSVTAIGLLGLGTMLTPGCARVAPYERETLARRDMELGRNAAMTAGEDHGRAYREGSSGGGDAKGGGCGCN